MANAFSSEELVEALRRALAGGAATQDEGITTQELVRAANISGGRALRLMHELVGNGELVATQIWRTNIHGVRQRVPGYVPGPNWKEVIDVR